MGERKRGSEITPFHSPYLQRLLSPGLPSAHLWDPPCLPTLPFESGLVRPSCHGGEGRGQTGLQNFWRVKVGGFSPGWARKTQPSSPPLKTNKTLRSPQLHFAPGSVGVTSGPVFAMPEAPELDLSGLLIFQADQPQRPLKPLPPPDLVFKGKGIFSPLSLTIIKRGGLVLFFSFPFSFPPIMSSFFFKSKRSESLYNLFCSLQNRTSHLLFTFLN